MHQRNIQHHVHDHADIRPEAILPPDPGCIFIDNRNLADLVNVEIKPHFHNHIEWEHQLFPNPNLHKGLIEAH